MTEYPKVAENIGQVVQRDKAKDLVALYFDPEWAFSGATFDTVGNSHHNEFDAADLLAITMLDVALPPLAVRQILGDQARALSSKLARLPAQKDLWEVEPAVLEVATELWTDLKKLHGVGSVKAGKLLARKRPRLIPVVDQHIIATLQAPPGQVWEALRDALHSEDLQQQIESLRGHVPAEISTLRLLDVTIWMFKSNSKNAREARERTGLNPDPA